jgi:hypothetical protein
MRTKDINKNRKHLSVNKRYGVKTLKRVMTNVGALQSTLGQSLEEKVDAADLDSSHRVNSGVTTSMARAATKVS